MKQKIIQQGAEAIIYKQGNNVIKDRIKKSYRISELDNKIRKLRTRSEAKLLTKASSVINCPKPFLVVEDIFYRIGMPFIDGKKLSQYLNKFPLAKQKQILNQIGKDVAKIHNADIIHGDLTTSNMVLVNNSPAHKYSQKNNSYVNDKKIKSCTNLDKKDLVFINKNKSANESEPNSEWVGGVNTNFQIFFIDFGLGFISKKIEDKAVDIHLLRQALEAKHFKHWEDLFKEILKGYKKFKDSERVLERLKAVEKRGRYRH